jgi:hypothetical protein
VSTPVVATPAEGRPAAAPAGVRPAAAPAWARPMAALAWVVASDVVAPTVCRAAVWRWSMAAEGASGGAVEAAALAADAAPDVAAVGDRRVLAGGRWADGGGAAARAWRSAGSATQWSSGDGAGDGPAAVERRHARGGVSAARAEECWRRRGSVELWRRRWSSSGGATSGRRGWLKGK